jgi:hypothetical protein
MQQIPGPVVAAPVRLSIGDDPAPFIRLAMNGESVDITAAVETLNFQITGTGTLLELVLRADIDAVDFVASETIVAVPGGVELTAEEIDGVLASKGMSETAGEALAAHLEQRRAAAR